jgi:hypothetical protein
MVIFFCFMTGLLVTFGQQANAHEQEEHKVPGKTKALALSEAFLCENILNAKPKNRAVVFSIALEKIICYTAFDLIPVNSFIYHKWYYRDKLHQKSRLILKPPRWAAFSRIELRKARKGPWRVEVCDQNDKVLQILRFSIVD